MARTGDGWMRSLMSDPSFLPVLLVALLVAAAAPVLRTLYPILYVIGEDWSYPGVGAVGVVLYLAPLLAAFGARLRPAAGMLAGTGLLLVASLLLVVADPISRYAVGAATVLALSGATLALVHVSATGAVRRALVLGLVAGLAVDTAVRGLAMTWDLVWRPSIGYTLLSLVLAAGAVAIAGLLARRDLVVRRRSSAARSAVVATGGVLALQALFLQSPGFASSQSGVPYWAGVHVVLVGDVVALLAIPWSRRLDGRPLVTAVVAAAAFGATALLTVATGPVSIAVVVVAQLALFALLWLAFLPEGPTPLRAHAIAAPARAAGAAVVALLVVFGWQFYVDTPLPFPRWVIPLVPVAVLTLAAMLASRRDHAPAGPDRRVVTFVMAKVAVLAVVVVPLLWWATPSPSAAGTSGRDVTVMTYNIRSGADVDGQMRPDAIADVIRSYDADVVVLQEVGRGWPIHAGVDVASYLERELGYGSEFMGAADEQFGNVILSRLPMTPVSSGYLPDAGGQRRSYLAVSVDVGGAPLLVVGTHLEDRSVPQIDAVLGVLGSTQPAVLAGDLNTWPDLPEAAEHTSTGLVDVVAATGDPCRTTSAQPTRPCDRPDWILVTPDITIGSVEIGTTPASDHLPLVAHMTLPS